MWESPTYKFERRREDSQGKIIKEEITIDVTGSAPTMSVPGEYLESVFQTILKGKNPSRTIIVDFGAAKLRNTLHLLNKGYYVSAVEFKELSEKMPQAKQNWSKAIKDYPKFHKLIFPQDFYKLKDEIDVVLMVNVMNVMPVPMERIAALALCRKIIKPNGLIYLLNWKPASSQPDIYNEKNKINDGWYKGTGRSKKTFHVEWTREEAIEMLAATGFSLADDIEIDKTSSQSYVFRADKPALTDNILKEYSAIKNEQNKLLPEIRNFSILDLYIQELNTFDAGPENSTKFRRIVARILLGIFNNQLKNVEEEVPIAEGLGKIDIKLKNKNVQGFFKNLKEMHDIKCPSVFAECKNYTEDIGNPEFDQLSGRLDKPDRCQFGFLVCRKIKDKRNR